VLLAEGRTVAVIGSGLDRLYPSENKGLARQIAKSGGAVITEYPFGRSADRQTFPMRNRIISGLSTGILVIEAGTTSGTLITVDHALEQGRHVMAIPGRIDSPGAQGCHKLIKSGARLIETPEEVLDEIKTYPNALQNLVSKPSGKTQQPEKRVVELDEIEQKILEALSEGEMSPDSIVNITGVSAALVSPRLISLEMKCQIERIQGNMVRLRKNLL
jgi:DNA processing protein